MRYTFARCVLDTATRELTRDGVIVPLEPKGYQVLLFLVEHRDRVVTRDELLSHAWPGVYVVDTTVARCLTLIRKAVGDSGAAQAVVKTLHGHGYRFVASVVSEDQIAPSALPMAAPVATPDAGAPWSAQERRHATVLGGALVPSFSLVPGVDAESQQALLEALEAAVDRAVAPYDGHLLQLTSERVSVAFGMPLAQEDHAERAVLAALALRREWDGGIAPAWQALIGVPIALGLGLHTGPVVVNPAAQGPKATALAGDVLPIAEHLARHAAGAILISAALAPLVGAVAHVSPDRSVALPGRDEPLVTWRVAGPVAAVPPGTALGLRHHGPFIGRRDELSALHAQFSHVRGGYGRSVGLVGPPGMGKSRMVAEFVRGLDPLRCTVVFGRCQSRGQHTAYLPLVDLLHRWWQIEEADPPAVRATKAQAALEAADMADDSAGAQLLRLLGLPSAAPPVDALSPPEQRAQTFAALHALFLHHAERRALVVVIEDAHWIDATSEAYLNALAARLASKPLMLLATLRPGSQVPWQGQSLHTQLALAPLGDEDGRTLVRAIRRGAPLQARLEAQIVARAQGNPFFVEALTHAVTEQAEPDTTIGVPQTIDSILAARIDRLPPDAKRLLQAAAIIGPDVPLHLLRGLSALPDAAIDAALQALQSSELLHEARVAPQSVYAFQHGLVQEVAYQSLLRHTRLELHRRVVALLDADADSAGAARSADSVERLAHHARLGELWEPALRYAQQAGLRAFARGSNPEAVVAFEQAIAANDHLPQDRAALERAVDLRLALRSALLPSGDFARTLACVREAEQLAEALGDPARIAQVAFFLSLHLYLGGQHREAVRAGRRAQSLTEGRDPTVHAIATYLVGIPLQAQGLHAQATACFEQSLAALDGAKRRQFFNLAVLPSVTSCAFLATCGSELGRFEQAHHHGALGLEIAEAVGHPPSVMFACWGVGWAAFRQGDAPRAIALFERALGICREVGLALHFPMVAVPLGSSYLLAGRTEAAVTLLRQTLERIVAHDMVNFQGVCRFSLAEALVDCGRLDEAAECSAEALAIVRRQEERGYEAYALRARGELERRRGQASTAVERARESLAIAEELGLAPLQAHCRADIGAAHAQQGQARQARAALARAIEGYRSLAMSWHEQQSQGLLASLK